MIQAFKAFNLSASRRRHFIMLATISFNPYLTIMKIKACITGSTGMIGKGLLLECLDSADVESLLLINRRPLGIDHPKLKEIIHQDMFDISAIKGQLTGCNTCWFCLGVTSAGMSEADYNHITFKLTTSFAKTFLEQNPGSIFCYVSGAGTDSTEKGRVMWARIKGKTENTLINMAFKKAYMFRPGYIQPMRGIKSRTAIYNIFYIFLKPFYFILKSFPKYVTSTDRLARAMIKTVAGGEQRAVLESADINEIADS
jgi:hypothetical protein